jgi:hypothetical protein
LYPITGSCPNGAVAARAAGAATGPAAAAVAASEAITIAIRLRGFLNLTSGVLLNISGCGWSYEVLGA